MLDGVRHIGRKWFCKLKIDKDENISVFQGKVGGKGFRQRISWYYDETFEPIVMLKYEIWQVKIKTAFLNRFLKEDMYTYSSLRSLFMD